MCRLGVHLARVVFVAQSCVFFHLIKFGMRCHTGNRDSPVLSALPTWICCTKRAVLAHRWAKLRCPVGPLQSFLGPLRPRCLGAGHMAAGRWANVLVRGFAAADHQGGLANCVFVWFRCQACAALRVSSFLYHILRTHSGRRYCHLATACWIFVSREVVFVH